MNETLKAGDRVVPTLGSGLENGLYLVKEVYVEDGALRVSLVGVREPVGLGSIVKEDRSYVKRFTDTRPSMQQEVPKGHSPDGSGLPNHSIGDIYPLAVVGYSTGDGPTLFSIENLKTGAVCCADHRTVRQWVDEKKAREFALRVAVGLKVDEVGHAVVFHTGRPVLTRQGLLVLPSQQYYREVH